MENVSKCTRELTEAILASQAYKDYQSAKEELHEYPELRKQLDQFRKRNYEIQNSKNINDWYEVIEQFEKESEEFRKNPLIKNYLNSELELCRMMQRINFQVMRIVDMEIQEFADVIDC